MAKLDDLEFRITASTDLLRSDLNRGTQAIQQFTAQNTRHINELHNRFEEVSRKLRQVFAFVGIDVGIRAFKSWIEDATNINKLTAEQAQQLAGVKTAFAELNRATDDLAQTLAVKLAPSLETAAKFWREFLFPTQGESADKRIAQINQQLEALNSITTAGLAQSGHAFKTPIGAFWESIFGSGDQTELVNNAIAQIKKLEAERAKLVGASDQKNLLFGNLDGLEVGTSSTDTGLPASIKKLNLPNFSTDTSFADLERQMTEFVNNAKLPDFKFPEINLENFKDGIDEMEKMTHSFAKEFGQGLHNALVGFILDGEHRFSDFIKQLAAEVAVSGLFNLLSGSLAGSTGSTGKFFSQVFGGGRADGGPVSAGVPYLVGEHGPELFMPSISGSISPNGAGGNVTVNQEIHLDSGIAPVLEAQARTMVAASASLARDAVMSALGGRR